MIYTEAENTHRSMLARWRGAMNLVGPGPLDPHFVDAVGAVHGLQAKGQWADLGSGAGFPGIAFAARHPGATILLVESRAKRATFLSHVVREAKLQNATVFHGRVEDLPGEFDGVISRAFRPPVEYLRDAERLLVPSGVAVLLTGANPPPFSGWRVQDSAEYAVTEGTRVRTVLVR